MSLARIIAMMGAPVIASYLAVGGGGAGGSSVDGSVGEAGTGGAGGFRPGTMLIGPGTSLAIIIGAGGAPVIASNGEDGSATSIGSLVTADGGGGGGSPGENGRPGASGGGGGNAANTSGGAGTAGEGFAGGGGSATGGSGGFGISGGGGGAGGAGGAHNRTGGDGLASSITGTSVFYAVGGGQTPTNHPGGGGFAGLGGLGTVGENGIAIIAYPSSVALATGGTITSYSSGGVTYQVHTFTASGTFTFTG